MGGRRYQVRGMCRYGGHKGGLRGRAGDIGRGDGIVGSATGGLSQRGSDCRGRTNAIRRGDGTVRVATGVDSQPESVFRGRAGDIGRGDGIVGSATGILSQRGFSLIEIILVVVLIGGIVAFAATRILGGGDRAKYNLAKAQVQTLAEKVGQFEMDTGALPASLDQLVTQPGTVGWLGPYAKESELKDPWNTPYEYRAPGEGQPFDIVSYGADRKPGGDSVNADIRNE